MNFVKLCTCTVNLDDVSSTPNAATVDPVDGKTKLVVQMTGTHCTLMLTDPDDIEAFLAAVVPVETHAKKHKKSE